MEHDHPSCSGVILAGGLGTRYSGINKAFLDMGGRRIIDILYGIFASLFHEIIIVTNNPTEYLDFDAKIVTDIFPVRSSLTGIHTGLFYAAHPFIFVTACDSPFIRKELVELVLSRIEPHISVVIPETSSGMEPLFAAYSKNCLPVMEQHIRKDRLKIQRMFNRLKVKKIAESALRSKDPELVSFFNINTPEDWEKAHALIRSHKETELKKS
jgi:molybdopterin-guanine dinucleotide biosynthesis protein A